MPMSAPQGDPSGASVHDMFKDVPQDELLQMMEEGQQFIKYLEENGSPEEKKAFAQAMEDTLQGFSEDDWKEFEQIVETVQDKLPPLVIEPKEELKTEAIKIEEPKKEEVKKSIVTDNSIEKMLLSINKAVNAILIKTKSDKILSEQISIIWSNKDNFNEMNRLLLALNTEDHIAKLTSSKDEDIKSLVESIKNFNTRLQIDNDQFIIADTFGLAVDKETTVINLKKLNKILDFFDNAIESLLPKLVKFMKEYEPEALKKSKNSDDSAKKALDGAIKVEKQKRSIGNTPRSDRYPSHGSQNRQDTSGRYNPGHQGSAPVSRDRKPGHLEEVHMENIKRIPGMSKKSDSKDGSADKSSTDNKKEIKKTSYDKAIDTLEDYLESNGNSEVGNYMATVSKAGSIYKSFGAPISNDVKSKAVQLTEKRSITPLKAEEQSFLSKYEDQLNSADKNFAKNTQEAQNYYHELEDPIQQISGQVDEMQKVLSAVKSNLDQMSSQELEKLNASTVLKNFEQRVHNYHATLKNVQQELRNKSSIHKMQRENPYEEREYKDLAMKIDGLHGLNRKISEAKSQIESLRKSIKSATARRKRDENKAAQ